LLTSGSRKQVVHVSAENVSSEVSAIYVALIVVRMPNVRDVEGSIWVEILVRALLALIFM